MSATPVRPAGPSDDATRTAVPWGLSVGVNRITTMQRTLVVDSITQGGLSRRHQLVVCGSHGGAYAAAVAAAAGVGGAIFNDAGRGRDDAGVAGLAILGDLGIPAAAVSHESAPIGSGARTLAHGVLSIVNSPAAALGWRIGMLAADAVRLSPPIHPERPAAPAPPEGRVLIEPRAPRVWALDSASLVRPDDAGSIVVTGSHGGLLGSDPRSALRASAAAAVFNDAGVGWRGAGIRRLAALDQRGIPAITVAAMSARVGDGLSTYRSGIVSHVNGHARQLGAAPGLTTVAFVDRVRGALAECTSVDHGPSAR